MSDFSKKQPKPQPRPSTQFDPQEGSQAHRVGEDPAPLVGLPDFGPGKGVPANKRTIR